MHKTLHRSVLKFLDGLDDTTYARSIRLFDLLEALGSSIAMPHSKPLGRGLFELRCTGHPAVRFLYGYCHGRAIIVLAIKKKTQTLFAKDIALARTRLDEACEI